MGKVAAAFSDLAIITSDNPRTEDPLEIIDDIEGGMESGSTRYAPEEIKNGFTGKGYTVLADRKAAIDLAVSVADSEDIVLIAGKGHEDYQIVGTHKFPFDDRAVAREALFARGTGGFH
jgi:UDP-N-acetylmuramoyl-L-alanyl-D-glutamate--2,6-diaminopimelate ligase